MASRHCKEEDSPAAQTSLERRDVTRAARAPAARREWYIYTTMPRAKVTLTLSTERLEALRELAGARSLSAVVDQAVALQLDRLRHFAAVDDWLAEMERAHGPIPPATLEWAATLVDEWDAERAKRTRRAG
jgi:hypothetical protein